MTYISVNDAAVKWNISERRVQQMCKAGEIEGAVKKGRSWFVPEEASQPVRLPLKETRARRPLPIGISCGYFLKKPVKTILYGLKIS